MATKKKAVKKKAATKKRPKAKRAPAPRAVSGHGQMLAAKLQKKYQDRVSVLSDEIAALAQVREFIPSGLDVVDNFLIGRGGAPVGRIIEMIGEEACGKTALLYRWLGCVQRMGGVAALGDAEHSFDEERARVHGLDISQLVMEQPSNLEEALEMIKDTVGYHNPKHGPLLVGLDSIASLNTKKGISLEAGEVAMGEAARILSDELRDLPKLLNAHRAHLICINQIRHKIGRVFGSNITTPGGKALGFYSSVRLQFFGGKAIKINNQHVGKVVTLVAIKNRFAPPFRKARIRFDYATGYNNTWTTVEHAKTMKVVKLPKSEKGKGSRKQPTYLDALEGLDWDVNTIGLIGLENTDLTGTVGSDDDDDEDDEETSSEADDDEDEDSDGAADD